MAIRFNTKKFEQIKVEYLKYLETGSTNTVLLREFEAYKMYLDVDDDVKAFRAKLEKNSSTKVKVISPEPPTTTISAPQDKQYEHWEKKVGAMVENILKSGIDRKNYNKLVSSIQMSKLTKSQRRHFIGKIDEARNKWNYKEKLRTGNIFSLTFIVKSKESESSLIIDQSSILTDIANKTVDLLDDQQARQLFNTIEICSREFPDIPLVKQIQEAYGAYYTTERMKMGIRSRAKRSVASLNEPKIASREEVSKDEETIVAIPKFEPKRIVVAWEDIRFFDNLIRIATPIFNKPILVREKCRASYNQIKELLAEKLPEIIIEDTEAGDYKLENSIPLGNALTLIQKRETEELFDDNVRQRVKHGIKKALLIAEQDQELLLQRLRERKQRYINYLISLHLPLGYNVIPAVEVLAHESSESIMEEDAFIFTLPSRRKGCVTIVYENVNVARASILCVVEKDKYMDCLQSIFNFMGNDNIKNKRENLRLRPTIKAPGVLSVYSVNHTEDMHDWAVNLKK